MPRVLIVDDVEDNRVLLVDALEDDSYVIDQATDGAEALAAIEKNPPDIVLLDIMMPNVDGFECLQRIRFSSARHIPVIMVTALTDEQHIVRGLESGATDYITKPFSAAVVRARVRSVLWAKLDRDQLEDRTREVNQIALAVSTGMHGPMASLSSAVGALTDQLTNDDSAGPVDRRSAALVHQLNVETNRMIETVNNVLKYAQVGNAHQQFKIVNLTDVIRQVTDGLPSVTHEFAGDDDSVLADEKIIHHVIRTFVNFAINRIGPETEGAIAVSVTSQQGVTLLRITDNGRAIVKDQLESVFEPSQGGIGLALTIARRYVEAIRGKVWLESDGESMTTAVIEFPRVSTWPDADRAAAMKEPGIRDTAGNPTSQPVSWNPPSAENRTAKLG